VPRPKSIVPSSERVARVADGSPDFDASFEDDHGALLEHVELLQHVRIPIEVDREHREIPEFRASDQTGLNRQLRFASWAPTCMNCDDHRLPGSTQRVKRCLIVWFDLARNRQCRSERNRERGDKRQDLHGRPPPRFVE
jgi:hypothetical protein